MNYLKPLFKTRYYSSIILKTNDGNIFLSKRQNPNKPMYEYLQCPGGQLEQGEDFEEAATRELMEESGLVYIEKERLKQLPYQITNGKVSDSFLDYFAYTPYQKSEYLTKRIVQPFEYTLNDEEIEIIKKFQENEFVTLWQEYNTLQMDQLQRDNQPMITAVKIYIKEHIEKRSIPGGFKIRIEELEQYLLQQGNNDDNTILNDDTTIL